MDRLVRRADRRGAVVADAVTLGTRLAVAAGLATSAMTLDGFIAAFARHAPSASWRLIDRLWTVPGRTIRTLTGWMGHTDSPLTFVAVAHGCPRGRALCALDWPGAADFLGLSKGDARTILRTQDGAWFHDRELRLALLMACNLLMFDPLASARRRSATRW